MCILAFSSIYIIQFIEKSFLFNFCEKFVFSSSKEHSLHKAWFENVHSPWEESRGQNENMCGEYGGCVRFVLSENRFATVAQWPRISFATSETVSPLAMWRMVSATPEYANISSCFYCIFVASGKTAGEDTLFPLFSAQYIEIIFYLSPCRRPGDGRYCNAAIRPSVYLSVRPSVTFSFRTVTRKRIDVFSQTLQVRAPCHGVCCIVFYIDGMLFEFFMNFLNI